MLLFASSRIQLPIAVQAIRPIALVIGVQVGESATGMAVAVAAAAVVEMALSLGFVRFLEGPISWRSGGSGGPVDDPHTRVLVFTTAVTQAAPAIDSVVVASLGPGSLAIYSLASRFYDVGKSAFLQPNARLAQNRLGTASHDPQLMDSQVRFEVRRALTVGMGAMVALAVAGPVCIRLLFRRDEFTAADAQTTSGLVVILAVSMLPWALAAVLPRALVILGGSAPMRCSASRS